MGPTRVCGGEEDAWVCFVANPLDRSRESWGPTMRCGRQEANPGSSSQPSVPSSASDINPAKIKFPKSKLIINETNRTIGRVGKRGRTNHPRKNSALREGAKPASPGRDAVKPRDAQRPEGGERRGAEGDGTAAEVAGRQDRRSRGAGRHCFLAWDGMGWDGMGWDSLKLVGRRRFLGRLK
ncbi:hypothetical protein BHE74_00051322 [Ensete ventricosum]|nr:hypothetical protein BHE74_00051322 [Ensete ventricosum]